MEEDSEKDEGLTRAGFIQKEEITDEFAAKNIEIPWRVNFNINYTLSRANINRPEERLNVATTASISLTKNWRVNWNGRFDLTKGKIVYQSFSIYRDLHCWEMSFNWQPSIDYYSFQINVKASALQDLKVTKRGSSHPITSFFSINSLISLPFVIAPRMLNLPYWIIVCFGKLNKSFM